MRWIHKAVGRPSDEFDEDAGPVSIYDGTDHDTGGRPLPPPRPAATGEVKALTAAVRLGRAEALVARLDERLAASPFPGDATARVALDEAAAFARLCGWQGGAGRLGRLVFDRSGVEDDGDVRALWVWRELARAESDRIGATDPAVLAERLSAGGFGSLDAAEAFDVLQDTPALAMTAAERRDRAGRWIAAAAGLPVFGPVATGAALFATWTAQPGTAWFPGAVIAMRFAAGRDLRTLRFLPLTGGGHFPFGSAMPLPDRVLLWASAAADAAAGHLLQLDRLAEWRDRAEGRVRSRLAWRLLPLFHAAPLCDSAGLARRLGVTPQYVNRALQALAAEDLIEETTGSGKYRLWRARPRP